ncbi:MAG: hypothetical protein ACTS73_08430 [Arsenophonus sp. NEOnobi-MAG3]
MASYAHFWYMLVLEMVAYQAIYFVNDFNIIDMICHEKSTLQVSAK